METTKRIWKSPVKGIEQFMPQNYCGTCVNETHGITYEAHCCDRADHGYVFWDRNGNGKIDEDELQADGTQGAGSTWIHGGCDRTHTWEAGTAPQYNSIVLLASYVNRESDYFENGHKLKSEYIGQEATVGFGQWRRAYSMVPRDGSDGWLVCYDLSSITANLS